MAIRTVYEPEEPDPFRDFTFTEMLAFIHKSQFATGLSAFFSEFDSDYGQQLKREYKIDLWSEVLTDAADELRLLGLPKVAAICMEEAAKRPSKFDRPNEWHSSEDKFWRESMERQRKAWEQQHQQRASRKNGHAI